MEEERGGAGGTEDMEDALPAGDKGMSVALEDLEEAVEGHAPDLDVRRRLRAKTGLCLLGEGGEYLRLYALLKVGSASGDVLWGDDENLVQCLGCLQSNRRRSDDVVLDKKEMRSHDVPTHSRLAIDEAMDVEERDDAELGDAE